MVADAFVRTVQRVASHHLTQLVTQTVVCLTVFFLWLLSFGVWIFVNLVRRKAQETAHPFTFIACQWITPQIAVSSQPNLEALGRLYVDDFCGVLNLAHASDPDFVPDEGAVVQSQGAVYQHIPIRDHAAATELVRLRPELLDAIMEAMDALPKPLLVHCPTGILATVLVLVYYAEDKALSADDITSWCVRLGLKQAHLPDVVPLLRRRLEVLREQQI